TTPPRPLDAYSRSKYAAEMALTDVLPESARLIVVRPVNHSGAGQVSRNFALASFAAQIVAIERGESEPRISVGDLSKARDFLDVRDVVEAYVGLLSNADRLDDRRACFNVASGRPETLAHLLDTMRAHALRPFEVTVDPKLIRPAKVDIPTMACDAARLRAAIGWAPRFSAEDMVVDLLSFWRGRRDLS
ncbi:MAG: NAD-dependent epimerase/dehydratase family protein, partial [Phyllobacteriaceae bacterium]|nr:NAD-dependent epimerase/dehydratase family protein [Phyllobacteriaceae bacterium]